MASWRKDVRWHLGGNIEPVRMTCLIDWTLCPSTVLKYIWSEIVTDVIDSITLPQETTILQIQIVILFSLIFILLYLKWLEKKQIVRDVIENIFVKHIDAKIHQLEMRLDVLAYKVEYGKWTFPQKSFPALATKITTELEKSSDTTFSRSGCASNSMNDICDICIANIQTKLRKGKSCIQVQQAIDDSTIKKKSVKRTTRYPVSIISPRPICREIKWREWTSFKLDNVHISELMRPLNILILSRNDVIPKSIRLRLRRMNLFYPVIDVKYQESIIIIFWTLGQLVNERIALHNDDELDGNVIMCKSSVLCIEPTEEGNRS